jgi:PhnB protein
MKPKEVEMTKAKNAVPEGFHAVTPVLTLDNAAQAIEWYKKAFGAEEKSRAVGPDGKILHADLRIGDSRIMLNDPLAGGKPQGVRRVTGVLLDLRG